MHAGGDAASNERPILALNILTCFISNKNQGVKPHLSREPQLLCHALGLAYQDNVFNLFTFKLFTY